MRATHTVRIPINNKDLSLSSQSGHILDNLRTGSLISIGKFCDDNCAATFTKKYIHIVKNVHVLIKGTQNKSNVLWNIPLSKQKKFTLANTATTTPDLACSIISSTQKKSELSAFLHGTILSPMLPTLLRAIKCGHFTTFPGLTTYLITKHPPKYIATSKGHLRGQQKRFIPKKFIKDNNPLSTLLDIAPMQEPTNLCTQQAFYIILDRK